MAAISKTNRLAKRKKRKRLRPAAPLLCGSGWVNASVFACAKKGVLRGYRGLHGSSVGAL